MNKMNLLNKKFGAFVLVIVMTVAMLPANTVMTNAASVPSNLAFQETEDGAVISWSGVSGADSYNIYEAASRYAAYEKIDTVSGTTYTDEAYDGGYYKVAAVVGGKETEKSEAVSYEIQTFGTNTYIFEDTDTKSDIQNVIDTAYKVTGTGQGQFCSDRYAFLFKPSENPYDVTVDIGFYTQAAGLGISPEDVTVKQIQSMARWMVGRKYDGSINYSALCNFWRSVENMSSPATDTVWAVSQATSMRRMNLTGSQKVVDIWQNHKKTGSYTDPKYGVLYLHDQGGYASGGFLADTKISTNVSSGSQQQWLSRNIESGVNAYNKNAGNYEPAVWNNVLVGSKTSITASNWPQGTSTVVPQTPVIAEKPYLIYDDMADEYGIVVPKVKKNTSGVSWENMTEDDYTYISIDDCYVAKPTDSADKINAGIADKKALLFTPGIYQTDKAIEIKNNDTVVLGMGLATIKPTKGNQCMTVADVQGVRIAGVLFDAGRVESQTLLTVGSTKNNTDNSANPIILSDCFFRVGGADSAACRTKSCVIVNSNDVICDNFWVWRADHGSGVAWDKNTADNGVIFNGKNLTAYGLMVEHFQKVQTQWNADGGRCYMYQSELPYDITSQSVWNEPGSYGYTDYKVASNVKSHEGYGIGIYSCYQKAQCFLKSAITCPDTPGVKFSDVCTYSLSGNGSIDYAINQSGYAVMRSSEMCKVISYSNGVAVLDKELDKARKYIWSTTIQIAGQKSGSNTFKKVYTGKKITPAVSVVYGGITLRNGIDYKVTYTNNKKMGAKAKIKISGLGNFKDSESYKFQIVPAKVKVTKKKINKKKITLKWKKVKGVKKYEVKYATKKNFKKKVTVTKIVKKNQITIRRKKKKTAYYVKIRAFKKVGKKKVYGNYSKVVKAKK